MPYLSDGALKISDHQVRSPLLNAARACQVCHRSTGVELIERVHIIPDRTRQMMDRALDAVVALIAGIELAAGDGASNDESQAARQLRRRAQYRVDIINAENSMGFHAPQEAALILGEAIDYARRGRLSLTPRHPGAAGDSAAGGQRAPASPSQGSPDQ